jgi:hypothetical protein
MNEPLFFSLFSPPTLPPALPLSFRANASTGLQTGSRQVLRASSNHACKKASPRPPVVASPRRVSDAHGQLQVGSAGPGNPAGRHPPSAKPIIVPNSERLQKVAQVLRGLRGRLDEVLQFSAASRGCRPPPSPPPSLVRRDETRAQGRHPLLQADLCDPRSARGSAAYRREPLLACKFQPAPPRGETFAV